MQREIHILLRSVATLKGVHIYQDDAAAAPSPALPSAGVAASPSAPAAMDVDAANKCSTRRECISSREGDALGTSCRLWAVALRASPLCVVASPARSPKLHRRQAPTRALPLTTWHTP